MTRRSSMRAFAQNNVISIRGGGRVVVETDHSLPLVDIDVAFAAGSEFDPSGLDGLANMSVRAVRKGPHGTSANAFNDAIDSLGAHFTVEVAPRAMRFRLTVLRRNVDRAFDLLCDALHQPALRPADIAKVKRRIKSAIVAAADDDYTIGFRHFRASLYEGHPYGRSSIGDLQSISRIKPQHIAAFAEQHFTRAGLVLGAAGDIKSDEALALATRLAALLPNKKHSVAQAPKPHANSGRRVIIVDKDDRTQSQLFIGTLGVRTADPMLFPLTLSNAVFGGAFSSRLMQSVRAERGWSYGAYSYLCHDRQRAPWYMWTAPGVNDSAACASLQLDLLDVWTDHGVSAAELKATKKFLLNSRILEFDTASRRLSARMDVALSAVPASHIFDFKKHVLSVSRSRANEATTRRIDPNNLLIVAVAPAARVAKKFEALPGVTSVDIRRP